ncbi:MAG TPA: NAD-dependent epimerase/dehydratase family protein [Rudaea sp.]|nr:NAD-dependent epimerase/dehydratase family protein [Rudaea sp.]
MTNRREFLHSAALLACAAPFVHATAAEKRAAGLRILVMGGTGFLGPHVVNAATARGHTMTLFNRGKTHPGLFPNIEQLHGDRKTDLSALESRRWDAVVDTSAYIPGDVARSAALLAPNVGQYLLISTVSVYAKLDKPGMDESAALATTSEPDAQKVTNENYGALKALCEQALEKAMPHGATVIRPGLIVGPGDPTDRFTYWPVRVARGGEVLAPGSPQDFTQFIDARDLADFIVLCLEKKTLGTFNADAQAASITMGRLLDTCRKVAKSDARFTWADAKFLEQQNVSAWSDMPAWAPAEGDEAGFGRVSAAKAKAAGLRYRPLDTTVADTLTWFRTEPAEHQAKLKSGIDPAREAEVLAAWHAAHSH